MIFGYIIWCGNIPLAETGSYAFGVINVFVVKFEDGKIACDTSDAQF